jgi:hypothetical protein
MDLVITRINLDETILSSDQGEIISFGTEAEITCLVRNGPTLARINLCVPNGNVIKQNGVPDSRRELQEMFNGLKEG